jgi:hypothetical protein
MAEPLKTATPSAGGGSVTVAVKPARRLSRASEPASDGAFLRAWVDGIPNIKTREGQPVCLAVTTHAVT